MYSAPIPAASVGVKNPPRMPPRMRTGAPIAGRARRTAWRAAAQSYGSPWNCVLFRAQTQIVMHSAIVMRIAGIDRGGEQGAGRDRGHGGEHDGRDARRHDRADQRRTGAEADGELGGIALPSHVVDLDRPDAGRVGQCRAAHPREAQADADVHVGQAGAKWAEEQHGSVIESIGDLGPGRDDPDEDEQRDRQQRPAVDAGHREPEREPDRVPLADQVQQARARRSRTPSARAAGTGRGSGAGAGRGSRDGPAATRGSAGCRPRRSTRAARSAVEDEADQRHQRRSTRAGSRPPASAGRCRRR